VWFSRVPEPKTAENRIPQTLLGLGRTKAIPLAPAAVGRPIPGEVVHQPACEVGQPAVTPRPRLEMRARCFDPPNQEPQAQDWLGYPDR
jgi:hypothetical protein